MNFLKTIKAHGFKSFANPITINFDHNLIGVVGPNGSGKSNINDAIRWVMGEQSAKQLRGNNMEDIIFNGSALKKPMNMAEVTLIFSNHNRIFSLNFDEISITRRIYRNDRVGEYFINGVKSRLKDVQKLAMEAGISKSSLSIISQGTVSKLAEAKPEEFRDFLDEAAGVSKYKKHKIESLRKLARTNENLEKINILIEELGKQKEPLSKQAAKATEYLKHKNNLEEIEVSFLASDINELDQNLKINNVKIKNWDDEHNDLNATVTNLEIRLNALNQAKFKNEKTINSLQNDLNNNSETINELKIELVREEEKRKHDINKSTKLTLNEKEVKILENNIKNTKNNLDILDERITTIKNDLELLNENINNSNQEKEVLLDEVNALNRNLNINNTKILMLKDNLSKRDFLFPGVKIILQHKESLPGIHNIINNLISYDPKYQIAIQNCLANNLQNIVCKDSHSAKGAVAFLKRNRAGKATFIPINDVKIRHLQEQDPIIASNTRGFIDTINNIIKIDNKYKKVINFLTNRIFLTDNLTNAIELNKRLNSRYRIITLEGDAIFPGGTISGGFNKLKVNDSQTIKNDILKFKNEIEETKNSLNLKNKELSDFTQTNLKLKEHYQEKYVLSATLYEKQKIARLDLDRLTEKYKSISNKKIDDLIHIKDSKNQKLSFLNKQQDKIVSNIKSQRSENLTTAKSIQNLELKLTSKNTKVKKIIEESSSLKIANNKFQVLIQNHVERLNSHYKLTFEYARDNYKSTIPIEDARVKIKELRSILDKIGNVNIDAISEYEVIKKRFDHLTKNVAEINKAKNEIETSVKSLDTLMLEKFSSLLIDVRLNFKKVFKIMFGGGDADLKYSDPEDALNSGIEIIVQPPGKSVKTLTLFSGGEKSLIVISLLFSILEARHLPLVILDEAEAPLDESNVARYGQYLKNFSEHTQFIVVTHRAGTMEYLNILYGATMQSAGITKIVGVKLKDAINLSEQESEKPTNNVLQN